MTRQELIAKTKELEESCRLVYQLSDELYQELLEEYSIYMLALKSIGDSYPWERLLEVQDQMDINNFEEYCLLSDLLGALSLEAS